MAIRSYIERFKQIDKLIKHKSTGTPNKFALKLGISERTLYEYLSIMKAEGAKIKYSATMESYYYLDDGNFKIGYHENIINN